MVDAVDLPSFRHILYRYISLVVILHSDRNLSSMAVFDLGIYIFDSDDIVVQYTAQYIYILLWLARGNWYIGESPAKASKVKIFW